MQRIKGWQDTYVDVCAKDKTGRSFIIEMQVLNHPGFGKRVLYNVCKTYVGQIGSALDTFRLRAAENSSDVTHQDMALVFVELPKFTKSETELETALERWLYFLKKARSFDMVPKALSVDPALEHALQIAQQGGPVPEGTGRPGAAGTMDWHAKGHTTRP